MNKNICILLIDFENFLSEPIYREYIPILSKEEYGQEAKKYYSMQKHFQKHKSKHYHL